MWTRSRNIHGIITRCYSQSQTKCKLHYSGLVFPTLYSALYWMWGIWSPYNYQKINDIVWFGRGFCIHICLVSDYWKIENMLLEPVDGIRWEKEGVCAHCRKTFSYRPNKRFCSSNCRKRNNEGIKNSVFSLAKRRENGEFFERSLRLAEVVYSAPPFERLGIMKDLIAEARTGEDRQLMDILTNQKLLRPNPAH